MFRRVIVMVCALALVGAAVSMAATNGRIKAIVTDNEGTALPGVTVTISSEVLIGGPQVGVTNENGEANFAFLAPGMYHIRTDLSGFASAEADSKVSLDRTTTFRAQMVLSQFADEIEVVADTPVIDTTQVDTGQVFDQEYLQNAAIGMGGRDYLSIVGQAAGVAGGANKNVYGSGASENLYLIDGMNTTDPLTSTFGTNFNYDAIQEISFLTGGFEAEYGQATGGIINLVTKSGGNELSGSLDFRYRDDGFNESGDHYDPDDYTSSTRNISATIGGPIIRDKIWFFVSVENALSERTPQALADDAFGNNEPFGTRVRTYDGWNYIGKITWQLADSHRLIFKYSGDPADIDNADYDPYTSPEAGRFQSQGGEIIQAELNSVLSDSILLTLQAGINRQELDSYPMSGDLNTPGEINADTGILFANRTNAQYSERDRDQAKATLTWFVDDLLGSHEFKGGIEYQKMNSSFTSFTPGGYYMQHLDNVLRGGSWYDGNGDGFVDYTLYANHPAETARDATTAEGDFWSYYIQDAWRPMPNLTVKPGVRMDTIKYTNMVGQTVADLDKLQPRIGVAWDVKSDGKHVIRANWGRFMHPGSLVLADTVSGAPHGTAMYVGFDYWCSQGYCDPDFLEGNFGSPFVHTGSDGYEHNYYPYQIYGLYPFETIDTLGVGNLVPAYNDQLILGYETEIYDRTSIEFTYVSKKSRDFFEDTCNNNTWAWDGSEVPSLDDPSTWTDEDNCPGYVYANIQGLKRDYRAYVLRFESRARDWFHVNANYTWSKSEGNYATEAYNSYATAGWDYYPTNFYNHYGFMGDHRRHRVKINGYFLLPKDWTIGVDAYWSSAPALTLTEDCERMLNATADDIQRLADMGVDFYEVVQYCQTEYSGTLFLEPRGSRRGKNNYGVDLQVSKGFNFGRTHLELIGTIINVFGWERATGYVTGALGPQDFGTVTSWQQPRRYELGVRLEF